MYGLSSSYLLSDVADLVDQSNLWSAFQSAGATTQPLPTAFPPVAVPLSQHGPVTATAATIPTTNADRDEQAPADDSAEVTVSDGSGVDGDGGGGGNELITCVLLPI